MIHDKVTEQSKLAQQSGCTDAILHAAGVVRLPAVGIGGGASRFVFAAEGAAASLDAAAAKVAKTNTDGEKKTAAADPAVTSAFKGRKVSIATNKISKTKAAKAEATKAKATKAKV